jgi:hypothetical protein
MLPPLIFLLINKSISLEILNINSFIISQFNLNLLKENNQIIIRTTFFIFFITLIMLLIL